MPDRTILLLRLEGLALFLASLAAMAWLGGGWWLFLALWLVPDLSMLGYLAGPRVGAIAYNTAHMTIGPLVLGLVALWLPEAAVPALAWASHVGGDRAMGYGLKRGDFHDTHLGGLRRG
ncbi:DUF4260 family protein [Sediminicoccus sp. KRV36]|uniref:DUF4260 family protein n=1 Tax=Sediminicoccus sp. KRV36 TaxID=3133721 RepID=UPI00200CBD3F|nr:DUF4260 family protein [Sediminicoccus rosea]UPY38141.1 DUF4260 domain-containing protein [Sediminicoccus rosea]